MCEELEFIRKDDGRYEALVYYNGMPCTAKILRHPNNWTLGVSTPEWEEPEILGWWKTKKQTEINANDLLNRRSE